MMLLGTVRSKIEGTENNYLFAGKQFDRDLGQYYLRQRYYNAESGEFTRGLNFKLVYSLMRDGSNLSSSRRTIDRPSCWRPRLMPSSIQLVTTSITTPFSLPSSLSSSAWNTACSGPSSLKYKSTKPDIILACAGFSRSLAICRKHSTLTRGRSCRFIFIFAISALATGLRCPAYSHQSR